LIPTVNLSSAPVDNQSWTQLLQAIQRKNKKKEKKMTVRVQAAKNFSMVHPPAVLGLLRRNRQIYELAMYTVHYPKKFLTRITIPLQLISKTSVLYL